MSRKHKSHRKQKITQSNAPAPFATAKKQAATPAPTQPENTAPAMDTVVAANTLPETEATPETASPATPITHLENEVEVAENQNHNTPANEDTVYSLDAHYDAQQANASVAASQNSENTASASPADSGSSTTENMVASLNEYEQLKRKNRRRLVGAGALVLVAGSLFAAASKDNVQNTPQLNPVKPVEQVQTEILRPAGSENKIDLSMDHEKAAPLVLKNNSVAPPLPQQNKAKATTMATAPMVSKPTPTTSSVSKPNTPSSEERAKAREEARAAEERRQKAQSKAAEAEAKRSETERAIANKARAAQAAADRNRNAERAQLTAERAAEEKQRAQRQAQAAANNHKANHNNTKSNSGGKSSIQAGAFADKEAARRMQQQLKDLNYTARLEEVQTSKGKMYRVRTGNFSNESEARSALNKLQNKGVNGMVVGK